MLSLSVDEVAQGARGYVEQDQQLAGDVLLPGTHEQIVIRKLIKQMVEGDVAVGECLGVVGGCRSCDLHCGSLQPLTPEVVEDRDCPAGGIGLEDSAQAVDLVDKPRCELLH